MLEATLLVTGDATTTLLLELAFCFFVGRGGGGGSFFLPVAPELVGVPRCCDCLTGPNAGGGVAAAPDDSVSDDGAEK